MRIVVIGKEGQLARSLVERGGAEIVTLGRPEIDLEKPETIGPAIAASAPDVVVNAAAYTAVDLAESEPERARAINAVGASAVAEAAAKAGAPIVHISTDYVFDGSAARPYLESDPVAPLGAYGASKLEGERLVTAANGNSAILRTAWVYSPFGKNFVRTMLRLASTRDKISVVADQRGSPTSALSLADFVLAVARNLVASPEDASLRGVFHAVGAGEATWAEFAEAIFARSAEIGGPSAIVEPIPTSAYPTPAARPANSRLSTELIHRVHGVTPTDWRVALVQSVDRLVASDFPGTQSS
ncbi:MAG: dTDP-4-dehydrorhamnose reductase [Methylocystaceae bacterium]|nr:MAG: dTDP-4-dehydrorhamnose reductase [Methylocystaceae bacterium]